MKNKTIVLVGALDTKGIEFSFVRDLIQARGLATVVVDFGILGDPPFKADVSADEVARAGGGSLDELRASQDKTRAMRLMSEGLEKVVLKLHQEGRLDGVLGMAGSGGTAIATAAMRALPVGVPKLMVSTVASADVSPYVGTTDITMMPSVVDVAGLNVISRRIYANAAGAIAGMVEQETPAVVEERPLISASMFGNTTQAVDHARELLEAQGYEVLVFHATGAGGRTMEGLIEAGFIAGNLDLTTTELADEVCGGVLSAGPDRLLAAARKGIPTVLVPGCVDMANFWGIDTVPEKYRSRNLYEWNPNVTLMRTNVAENKLIGGMIARAANQSTGPVAVLAPLKGVSQLDSPGGAFWEPEANQACFEAIKSNLNPAIPYIEMDNNINDPEFSARAVELLLGMLNQ
ncbi:MAG: Tm-1-like ATP-binding domain-containing protein [Anaerolineales bacterium]|nr:Tm-1-like ATP-binding domain-containing protein [Anaerolineales bacterium]